MVVVVQVFDCVIGVLVCYVVGVIDVFVRQEWIGEEVFGGQVVVIEIVMCQLYVVQVQVIGYVYWYWLYLGVQYVQVGVLDWEFDWYWL